MHHIFLQASCTSFSEMSRLNGTKFVKATEQLTMLYKFILDFQQTATI